jgi:hypothetical protein
MHSEKYGRLGYRTSHAVWVLTLGQSETWQTEIRPCHGASVPDVVAIGEEREPLAKWKERCGIRTENQIRLVKLAHMRYQHPDLDAITVFLQG